VAVDGTKIHANASRHSALLYEHAGKIEAQLQAEVAALMAKAEAADQADRRRAPVNYPVPYRLAVLKILEHVAEEPPDKRRSSGTHVRKNRWELKPP
jgi:hypothetical protein